MIRALVELTRPKLTPFVLALPGLGWALAHWDRALPLTRPDAIAWVVLAWWWLHAGTMWLNAMFDRDEGEVLLGRPVPPPPGTTVAGYLALAAAVACAAPAGPVPLACVAACAALAVGYSHRAVGWKAHRFGGPAVNVLGYGLLSPLAGFGVVGVSLHLRPVLVLIGVMFGVLGAYFAAQVFQEREDRARGYGTLVARCGAQAAVRATRWSLGAASGTLALLAVVGFLPRVVLLGLPGSLWVDRWCVQWAALPGGGGVAAALELSRRLGWSVALDLALLFAAYAADSFSGGPVAGLATARGLPG